MPLVFESFLLGPRRKTGKLKRESQEKKESRKKSFCLGSIFLVRCVKPGLAGHFTIAVIAYTGCKSECFIFEALKLSSFREHASI